MKKEQNKQTTTQNTFQDKFHIECVSMWNFMFFKMKKRLFLHLWTLFLQTDGGVRQPQRCPLSGPFLAHLIVWGGWGGGFLLSGANPAVHLIWSAWALLPRPLQDIKPKPEKPAIISRPVLVPCSQLPPDTQQEHAATHSLAHTSRTHQPGYWEPAY